MGMSIDEAIRRIDEHNYIHQRKEPRAIYISEALDMAIDIMRKYKKIEQIIEVWHQDIFAKDFECMAEIADVVEDGKID